MRWPGKKKERIKFINPLYYFWAEHKAVAEAKQLSIKSPPWPYHELCTNMTGILSVHKDNRRSSYNAGRRNKHEII